MDPQKPTFKRELTFKTSSFLKPSISGSSARLSDSKRSPDRGRPFDKRRSSDRRRSSTRESSSDRRLPAKEPYFRRSSVDRGRTFDRRSSDRRRSSTRESSSDRRLPAREPYFRRSSVDQGRTFDRRSSDRRRSSTRESSSDRRLPAREPYFRRRSSADRGRPFDRRKSSDRRRSSTRERSEDRRRSSARRPSAIEPYFRRRSSADRGRLFDRRKSSDRRRSSTRERSDERRKSSLKWQYFRRRSSTRPIFRRWSHVSSDEESNYTDLDYEGDWDSDETLSMEDSEHTLSTTIKTNIQMDEEGLGIILIQNGPYLQVSGLVEKGAAAKDNKLQAGDILLKIGHANVLGWTLRELRQLLHTVPIGTVLQIQVYRDFIKIPSRWQTALLNIPELKGPATDIESYASEENWISSEDSENESEEMVEENESDSEESYQKPERVRALSVGSAHSVRSVHSVPSVRSVQSVHNVKTLRSLSIEPLIKNQPKWISKDWHIFERKTYTFTVGSDIGCDIMIHKDFETESKVDTSMFYLTSSSPYWTMPKHKAPPSESSSSSVSDAFWLENVSYELE